MADKHYKESILERNARLGIDEKVAAFIVKQKQPYEFKIHYAEIRAYEFASECEARGLNYHVSVGGLDSITLLLFLRSIGINCPAISVSCLEDKSIQEVHEQLGIERLKPLKSKVQVIQEYGYPVLSKEIAGKISLLQNPSANNATVRHAIITGETGAYGGNRTDTRMKLSQKWLELFGGVDAEGAALGYKAAPFRISDRCCYWLKERPCDDWAKANNSVPYLGLMASEGGRRQKSLMRNGCNYFGKNTVRSAPFAIFSRQDLLRLALDLHVPVPAIYGEIARDPDGTLRTTGAQRTGCSMCGFGIQLEARPNRFDRLKETNPQEWAFWMYKMGWGEVLDYIGIGWRNEWDMKRGVLPGQITIDDICNEEWTEEHTYMIHIYARTGHVDLLKKVRTALYRAGFTDVRALGEMYEIDTKLYHVPITCKYLEIMGGN